MKKLQKLILTSVLVLSLFFAATPAVEQAQAEQITTPATGFTTASQVKYKTCYIKESNKNFIVNWGARGEECTFLSPNAQTFYYGETNNASDDYAPYETISKNVGGTNESTAPKSALYKALQNTMQKRHGHITDYQETRYIYRCTDCLKGDTDYISSFYSGTTISGTWDKGVTWNREHTWPDSKGLNGSDENDIIMLRPTSKQENESRKNTAYGASASFYDPGESVRGDCARIVLYVYVRWGNTSSMWGSSGVMESLNVLLDWMEEDPVDTWEMGRNDSVESVTGTRNIFVDYPEYAWLLFGRPIPQNIITPSGFAKNGNSSDSMDSSDSSSDIDSSGEYNPDDSSDSNTSSDQIPNDSSDSENSSDQAPDDSIETDSSSDSAQDSSTQDSASDSTEENSCAHTYGKWYVIQKATQTEDGLRERFCENCGEKHSEIIPKTGGDTQAEVQSCNSSLTAPISGVLLLSAAGVVLMKKRKK